MSEPRGRLYDLYADAYPMLKRTLPTGSAISQPLFIDPPSAYQAAAIRLMIVGQQTSSWYGKFGTDDLDGLLEHYRHFDLAAHGPPSPFWEHARRLQELLAPEVPDRGFVWGNLVACDQNRRRPDADLLDLLLKPELLRREVEILAPHAVVFFTGPHYDEVLRRMFPGVQLEQEKGFEFNLLSRVVHRDLPHASYRTFHPKYLRLNKVDGLTPIAERVRKHGACSSGPTCR